MKNPIYCIALLLGTLAMPVSAGAQTRSVPFLETFDDGLDGFTVVDANNDNKTWGYTNTDSYAGSQGAAFYTYGRTMANDWLISPAISLQGGKEYEVSFEAWGATPSNTEKLEVCYGEYDSPSYLTEPVLETTSLRNNYSTRRTFTQTITPQKSGSYYFGFHAVSEAWMFYLFVDSISIKEKATAVSPSTVTGLAATAGADGALSASVTFTAPSTDVSGAPITSLDSIVVTRGNAEVHKFTNVAAGSVNSFTDNTAVQGNNTYMVTPYLQGNSGAASSVSVFVGQDIPAAVDSATALISDDLPSLTASWTATATGANGGYVDPAQVRYIIAERAETYNGYVFVVKDTTEAGATSYNFNINPDEGTQRAAAYAVAPVNIAGTGAYRLLGDGNLILGAPYGLPLADNFDGMKYNSSLWHFSYDAAGHNDFSISSNGTDSQVASGSLACRPAVGYTAHLRTGKISLAGTANPVLSFNARANGSGGHIEVYGKKQDGTIVVLGRLNPTNDWSNMLCQLDEIADSRYVTIDIQFSNESAADSLFIDDVSLRSNVGVDVVAKINAPEQLKRGHASNITVDVRNEGTNSAGEVNVILYAGEQTFSQSYTDVTGGQTSHSFSFAYTPDLFDNAASIDLKAVAYSDADENHANDADSVLAIPIADPQAAPARSLTATAGNGNTVTLSWAAPAKGYDDFTDVIDGVDPWTIDVIGDWLTYSNDEALPGPVVSGTAIPHSNEIYAFIVIDAGNDSPVGTEYPAHSGTTYLSSFYGLDENGDVTGTDKWLISPELAGDAQHVTFYARSDRNHPDSEENLIYSYSTTTNQPAQFQVIGYDTVRTAGEWKMFSFDVPQGARYFAIEKFDPYCKGYWLSIDDINYCRQKEVSNYLVRVDGGAVVDAGMATTYNVENLAPGEHAFDVVANYTSGPSMPVSTTYNQIATGISNVSADAPAAGDIYSVTGVRIGGNDTNVNSLRPGVYIIGGQKVVVK